MKITKNELRKIIEEELENVLLINENWLSQDELATLKGTKWHPTQWNHFSLGKSDDINVDEYAPDFGDPDKELKKKVQQAIWLLKQRIEQKERIGRQGGFTQASHRQRMRSKVPGYHTPAAKPIRRVVEEQK